MKLLLTPLTLIFTFGLTLQASTLAFYGDHVNATYGSISLWSDAPPALAAAAFSDTIWLLGSSDEVVAYTTTLTRYAVAPSIGHVESTFWLGNQGGHCGGCSDTETLSGTVPLNESISLSASALLDIGNVPPGGADQTALIELSFGPITLTDARAIGSRECPTCPIQGPPIFKTGSSYRNRRAVSC